MGYHHLALATKNIRAIHHFYEEVMGFILVKVEVAPSPEGGWAKHFFYRMEDDSNLIDFWEIHDLPEVDPNFETNISKAAGLPDHINHLAFDVADLSELNLDENIMIHRSKSDIENPDKHLMKVFRDTKYLASACKLLFDIELHPIQVAILQEFWVRPFPMFIASRGFGKSFMLSLYAMMRALLLPNRKVVVVGAAFRQSKVFISYSFS